jgi:hypothetical protein
MCYDVSGNPVSFTQQILLLRLGSQVTPKYDNRERCHHFASNLNVAEIRLALIAFLSRKQKIDWLPQSKAKDEVIEDLVRS